jgi:hypothetical protein
MNLDHQDDKAAIREVLNWYFCGLDRREDRFFEHCFSEQVEYGRFGTFPDGEDAEFTIGRAAAIEFLHGVRRYAMSSHGAYSQHLEVDGDTATADTFAVAYLILPGGDGRPVLVRGLRYLDRLRKLPEGWRITRRLHIPSWQFEETSTRLSLLPQLAQ